MYIIAGDPNLEVSKIQSCSNPSFAILTSSSPYLVDRPPVLYHSLLQSYTMQSTLMYARRHLNP
jgi:hypothetical protein